MINNNLNIFDLHLHCHFSDDSEGNPITEIESALEKGLTAMCFTDHNDFGYLEPDGSTMFLLDFDTYIENMLPLKEAYKDKINVLVGLEQGLTLEHKDEIDNYDQAKRLDFIIGSSHVVNGIDPYYPNLWEEYDELECIRKYFENMYECVKYINNYDVYGHLDYITRYMPSKHLLKNPEKILPMDLVREILKELIYKGKGIEINTSGWRKSPFSNPCKPILQMYHDLGGEIITTGSDSHDENFIGDSILKAQELLKECGFKYQTLFVKRKPEFYKL